MKLYLNRINNHGVFINLHGGSILFYYEVVGAQYRRLIHLISDLDHKKYGKLIYEKKDCKKLFVKLAKLNGVDLCF